MCVRWSSTSVSVRLCVSVARVLASSSLRLSVVSACLWELCSAYQSTAVARNMAHPRPKALRIKNQARVSMNCESLQTEVRAAHPQPQERPIACKALPHQRGLRLVPVLGRPPAGLVEVAHQSALCAWALGQAGQLNRLHAAELHCTSRSIQPNAAATV